MDLLKKKSILLDLVRELTEGIVAGKKLDIKSVPTNSNLLSATPKSTTAKPEGLQGLHETQAGSLNEEASSVPKGLDLIPARESTDKQNRRARKGWPYFQEIFMLAAVNGEEVETLKVNIVQPKTIGMNPKQLAQGRSVSTQLFTIIAKWNL